MSKFLEKLFENTRLLVGILLALGLLTHFLYISHPAEAVFDEVYFGQFTQYYFTHEYYFDIHPPMGKLLLAGTAWLFGYEPILSFTTIGTDFISPHFLYLRFLPNLMGVLLPVIIFFFARSLGASNLAAFFAGLAVVLENELLVDSHYIFIDIFLPFFGFLGLTLLLLHRKHPQYKSLLLAGCFCIAMVPCIKWNGFAYVGVAGLIFLWDLVTNWHVPKSLIRFFSKVGALAAVFAIMYVGQFAIHFALVSKSGPGDAFMSAAFQKTLEGSSYALDKQIEPLGFWEKFWELQNVMYTSQKQLVNKHPYASPPYTWPLMQRPIYYWDGVSPTDPSVVLSRIYLIGNPFIWWAAFVSLIFAFIYWKNIESKFILYIGWAGSFLPFFLIKRDMFLYHYTTPLLFSIVIMAMFLFDYLQILQPQKRKFIAFGALLVVFLAGFLYMSPLSYGLPLSPESYNQRVWFKSWL